MLLKSENQIFRRGLFADLWLSFALKDLRGIPFDGFCHSSNHIKLNYLVNNKQGKK